MITYERYAQIRDSKGLKDSDVARNASMQQSVLSDWKNGKSTPKMDKMIRIADVLEMDYYEFVGPVGKYSSMNPSRPLPILGKTIEVKIDSAQFKIEAELLKLFRNATPSARESVIILLKNSQMKKNKGKVPMLKTRETV